MSASLEVVRSDATTRELAAKVPRITAFFWIVKILTTAAGEAASDYLVHGFNPYVAVAAGFVGFVIALGLQLAVGRYVAAIYWFAVLMVAVFGTMAADVLHVEFRVPYAVSTVLFAVGLVVVFGWWWRSEGTLSIHSIVTRRRELFYWSAVLATFAMGTAAGDLAAYTAQLGFLAAGLAFAAVFALPAIAYFGFRANAVACFWFAYVLTRPLGASFADWTGKLRNAGGLGIGDLPVATALVCAIALVVGYLTWSREDQPLPALLPEAAA